MRIVFIGCVEFSFSTLELLLAANSADAEVVGIVTRQESSFNNDFRSLEPLAIQYGIPYYFARGNKQHEMAAWIDALSPDVIYCFGWSYLLNREVLNIPRLGVIGYHPAELPHNRGRHPIIWALALGLQQTASTFFFMDENADSGDILSQEVIAISDDDDAASLYRKLTTISQKQVLTFTNQLVSGSYSKLAQDHSKANYWRKRGKRDGLIDWRMSANRIYNLVRALTRPYVGAHFVYNNEEIKVWSTKIVSSLDNNIEPGKVLKIDGNQLEVKCGEGALVLLEHDLATVIREGDYL